MLLPVLTSRVPGGGRLVGLRAPTNAAPTAGFTFEVSGLTATITDTSTDSDGTIVSRSMDWGDGGAVETLTGAGPWDHTYASAGTYNAILTVEDDAGLTDDVTVAISTQTLDDIASAADPLQKFADACGMAFKVNRLWIGNQLVGATELGGSGLDLVNSGVDQGQADARLGPGDTCLFNASTDRLSVASAALNIGTGSMAWFKIAAANLHTSNQYFGGKYGAPIGYLAGMRDASNIAELQIRTASGAFFAQCFGPYGTAAPQVNLMLRNETTALNTIVTNAGSGSVTETAASGRNADNAADFAVGSPSGLATPNHNWGLDALVLGSNAELVTATHRANLKAWLGL